MSRGNGIRRFHRGTSVVFVVVVIANFAARIWQPPPDWLTYAPLLPLAALLLTGMYLFVRPYLMEGRGRRGDGTAG